MTVRAEGDRRCICAHSCTWEVLCLNALNDSRLNAGLHVVRAGSRGAISCTFWLCVSAGKTQQEWSDQLHLLVANVSVRESVGNLCYLKRRHTPGHRKRRAVSHTSLLTHNVTSTQKGCERRQLGNDLIDRMLRSGVYEQMGNVCKKRPGVYRAVAWAKTAAKVSRTGTDWNPGLHHTRWSTVALVSADTH